MLTVLTPKEVMIVHVWLDTLGMDRTVKVSIHCNSSLQLLYNYALAEEVLMYYIFVQNPPAVFVWSVYMLSGCFTHAPLKILMNVWLVISPVMRALCAQTQWAAISVSVILDSLVMERHAWILMSVNTHRVIRMQHVTTLREAFYASVTVDSWVMGCLVYVSEVFMHLCFYVILDP